MYKKCTRKHVNFCLNSSTTYIFFGFFPINFNFNWLFLTSISWRFTPIQFFCQLEGILFFISHYEETFNWFFFSRLQSSMCNTKTDTRHRHFRRVISPLVSGLLCFKMNQIGTGELEYLPCKKKSLKFHK